MIPENHLSYWVIRLARNSRNKEHKPAWLLTLAMAAIAYVITRRAHVCFSHKAKSKSTAVLAQSFLKEGWSLSPDTLENEFVLVLGKVLTHWQPWSSPQPRQWTTPCNSYRAGRGGGVKLLNEMHFPLDRHLTSRRNRSLLLCPMDSDVNS